MLRVVLVAMLLTAGIEVAKAADPVEFKIGYLRTAKPRTAISLVDVPPENNGLAGAQAATADNNTTGQFLGQRFSLEDVKLK
ncbi:MAG: branched-chain amino acid ABC transporter substrate-binding protein, partial [Xanthobacteraceae bacterium]